MLAGVWQAIFGARAQVVVGALTFVVGGLVWVYFTFNPPTVGAVFHVSMFFGLVACYAIIATGLGFRATERVESKVERAHEVGHADTVEHADEVERVK